MRLVIPADKRVILALDVDNKRAAIDAVTLLRDYVGAFKIGFELFVSEGPSVVEAVVGAGGMVFLDLKYHDIPNTVAQASRSAVRLGSAFFDVHASGGRAMMTAAAEAARKESEAMGVPEPISLAVTVLTSLDSRDLSEDLGIGRTPEEQVVALARLAKACGMGGVVASPKEVAAIRNAIGPDFVIVTPGVRPSWSATDDQKRFSTPAQAVRDGADYLVIGRPILKAADPVEAAGRIIEELKEA